MAILNKKLKIKDSEGTTVDCNIYTTQTEAGDSTLQMEVNNESAYVTLGETNGYGATKGRVKINGETHAIMSKAGLPYTEMSWTEPGTYTFTVPAGITRLRVAVCGGGGGGFVIFANPLPAAGGQSKFSDILIANGGGIGQGQIAKGGTPNGNDGLYASENGLTNGGDGFAKNFNMDVGVFGKGGAITLNSAIGYTGGGGGYITDYVDVTALSTYEIIVGAGGRGSSSNAGVGEKGGNGFVLIAYGGDI